MKGQRRAIRNLEARVSTRIQHTTFLDYPNRDHRGVFDQGPVRIESASGEIVASRSDPRSAIQSIRRKLWWDNLDMLYFCGYALWTYMSMPFVVVEPGYELKEVGPWTEDGETWQRFAIRFPANIHTHCPEQVLYFDRQGLLRRHDYTPEAISSRAKAAHYCSDHRSFGGLIFPTRRRVYPRRADGTPVKRLTLVWIDIEAVRLQ